ncbi:MFS transporter [Sphingomonas oleivorans]|uniref:MFS transporter n=1 Tax=Sphingomonas oleivorans TaxID=1735121 RepID=A0A2T5FXR2_9SPHN|nr:peptide MFS transporter [Sphingomonas oleivorans]PTQ10923.1 MFS transporter [Sphingomonas oleivorans]
MTAEPLAPPIAPPHAEGTFFGQPRGLLYLAFTEAFERFSFYGMTSLLVLYMIGQLLLPGHVENIAGFATFRALIEALRGPLSTQALASQIYGLYAGFIYFTPVLGGIIADRLLGRRHAVMIGAVLMSAGHVAMAFDVSFLLALLLLVVGCGFLKGNISSQVGSLYPLADAAGRTRGFAIFSMAINFGAVAGPFSCGLLAQLYGWHVGFGAAGLLMLIGLAIYLSGYRYLPVDGAAPRAKAPKTARAGNGEWRRIAALIALMLISMFHSIAYYQVSNTAPVWISGNVDLTFFGLTVPVPWFQSVDPFFSVIGVPLLFALWKRQAAGRGEPGDIAKIGIGAAICAASNLLLALASLGSGKASILWPLAYSAGLGIAFLYYWPTLLALVSRAAPPAINATMIGGLFLTLFLGNNIIGWLGSFYEAMSHAAFWTMHAAIAATGALCILLFGRSLERLLATEPKPNA